MWVLYNASNRASGFQKLLPLRGNKSQLSEMVLALHGQESTVLPHISHQRWIYLAVAQRTVLSKGYVAPKRRLQNFIYIYQSRQVPPPSKSTAWTQLTQQPSAPRPHGSPARPALGAVALPCAPPSCLWRIRIRRYRSIIALLRPRAYDTVIRVRVAGWRRWRWRDGRVGGAFAAGVVLADVFDDLAGLEVGNEVWEGGGDWGSEGEGEDEEGGEEEGGCGVVHCWWLIVDRLVGEMDGS